MCCWNPAKIKPKINDIDLPIPPFIRNHQNHAHRNSRCACARGEHMDSSLSHIQWTSSSSSSQTIDLNYIIFACGQAENCYNSLWNTPFTLDEKTHWNELFVGLFLHKAENSIISSQQIMTNFRVACSIIAKL